MKRVIAGPYVYLSVLWVGLNVAGRCNETKKDTSGPLLTWHNVRYFSVPLGLLLLIATCTASAAAQVVFSPTLYTWGVAQPTTYVDVFEIPNTEGTFTLVVENGIDQHCADRVTSTLFELNGAPIISPNEFQKKVGRLEKSVGLQESNQFLVQVRGQPGTELRSQ